MVMADNRLIGTASAHISDIAADSNHATGGEIDGEIDGEIQNDSPTKTLQSAELCGVVLDSAGNILGGGTGYGFGSLPPAARMVMKISSGLRPIPYYKAASAVVSVVPTYKTY